MLNIIKSKIKTLSELKACISVLRFHEKKIVFTNGCFDIIHRGHVEYLASARKFGDYMVVGLNSDSSVKKLKGKNRPVQDVDTRAIILSAFRFVDAVVIFDSLTPINLIEFVKPDILVKGADYKEEEIVGYEIVKSNGGEIKTIELTEGHSTTNIIDICSMKN